MAKTLIPGKLYRLRKDLNQQLVFCEVLSYQHAMSRNVRPPTGDGRSSTTLPTQYYSGHNDKKIFMHVETITNKVGFDGCCYVFVDETGKTLLFFGAKKYFCGIADSSQKKKKRKTKKKTLRLPSNEKALCRSKGKRSNADLLAEQLGYTVGTCTK